MIPKLLFNRVFIIVSSEAVRVTGLSLFRINY